MWSDAIRLYLDVGLRNEAAQKCGMLKLCVAADGCIDAVCR